MKYIRVYVLVLFLPFWLMGYIPFVIAMHIAWVGYWCSSGENEYHEIMSQLPEFPLCTIWRVMKS